jgi:hypothetical protein
MDRRAIIASKVGNRLEVGRETAEQPNQLEIPRGLPLKTAAGGNAVQIAIYVKLQQRGWMVRWASRLCRAGPLKPQVGQVQLVNERIDDTNRVVLVDVVINALRKQQALAPI